MQIIVLAGGLSTERDVSLSSAAGICRTLVEKGHDAFLLDVFMGLENAPENLEDVFTLQDHGLEIVKNISTEEPDLEAVKASRPDQSDCFFGPNVIELCRLADITFLGLHGGEGENGKLQASFDLLGIKYTGPDSLGCAVAMHKGVAKQIFLDVWLNNKFIFVMERFLQSLCIFFICIYNINSDTGTTRARFNNNRKCQTK